MSEGLAKPTLLREAIGKWMFMLWAGGYAVDGDVYEIGARTAEFPREVRWDE